MSNLPLIKVYEVKQWGCDSQYYTTREKASEEVAKRGWNGEHAEVEKRHALRVLADDRLIIVLSKKQLQLLQPE